METDTMSLEHIRQQTDQKVREVVEWFESFGPALFDFAPPEKWTAGQHLDHLIRSAKAMNRGLGLPKVVMRISFGKPNRDLRTYDAIRVKYCNLLAGGFKAVGPFIPATITEAQRVDMINLYKQPHEKYDNIIARWSVKALDRYLLPHPALGKLLVREMLYFNIIHTEHHLRILHEQYSKSG